MFNPFNPDIKITPADGKFFKIDSSEIYSLESISGINTISKSIEEVALFEYKESQEIGLIKGVDELYKSVTRLDTSISHGRYKLKSQNVNYAVIGSGMRNKLSLNIDDRLSPINVFMPLRKNKIPGAKEYTSRQVYPGGIFTLKSDEAYQYILTDYDFAAQLIQHKDQVSALEIKLNDNANAEEIKSRIQKALKTEVIIKNRYEQDESTLKMMEIEKWISFLIVGLVMLLIAFNLIGALWMIVLDKRKDIAVLKAMGYNSADVRSLFIFLGIMITLIGIILGFIIGIFFYYMQKEFGLIGISEGFLIDAYPVRLKITDFYLVTMLVFTIGALASLLPAKKASSTEMVLKGQ